MDPERFEQFVGEIWSSRGWNTTLTTRSYDRGIDVVAAWNGVISRTEAIQVKRYQSEKITSPEVQQYGSIPYQEEDVDTVIIVTSSSFSQPAQEVADDLNVKTVDADGLYQIITENSLSSVVTPYLDPEPEPKSESGSGSGSGSAPNLNPNANTNTNTNTDPNKTTQVAKSDLRAQHTPSPRTDQTELSNNNSLDKGISPEIEFWIIVALLTIILIIIPGVITALV